jgi:hypothetical protein
MYRDDFWLYEPCPLIIKSIRKRPF